MWFTTSSGGIEIQMTKSQALACTHPGPCDADVLSLSVVPSIARQLAKLDSDLLKKELREYGAWDEDELNHHEKNLQRILWIAAGDIADRC
jgi:hypothetical protein